MTRAAVAALVLVAATGTAGAQPVSPDAFRRERTVTVTAPGPQRLDLDAALLAGTQPVSSMQHLTPPRRIVEQGPPDLRLYTEAGVEVPYLLVSPYRWDPIKDGTVLPIAATEKTSGFEVDFREVVPAMTKVSLGGIPAPFLKRFRLEGSGDRVRWTVLIAEGTAFDLPEEHMNGTWLTFAATDVRYLRVTWDDTNSARVALPTRVLAKVQPTPHVSPPLRVPLEFETRTAEPGTSRFHVRLPGGRLPIDAIEVTVGGGPLLRDMKVLEARLSSSRRGQLEPVEIGGVRLRRVVRGDSAAESLRAYIQPPTESDLELVIGDGDNMPIDLQGVTAVFAELPWIYFESQPGTLIARYGSTTVAAPRYDLEAMRDSLPSTMSRATWGPERPERPQASPASGLAMPTRGSALAAKDFRYVRPIPSGPQGLTVVPLDAAALAHSAAGGGRFRDVRVLDRDGLQVPYLLEKRDEPMVVELRLERREPSPAARARPGSSEYVVSLPHREINDGELVLTTRSRVFQRIVKIGVLMPPDRQSRTPTARFTQTRSWQHNDDAEPAPALTLKPPSAERGDVVIEIDEGDNQPLPIERATLLLPSYAVRFYRSDAAPLFLAYGRADLVHPQYDLSLLERFVLGQRAQSVQAGPERGSDAGSGSSPASTEPGAQPSGTRMSSALFWGALGLSVVVLLGVVVRLVRRET